MRIRHIAAPLAAAALIAGGLGAPAHAAKSYRIYGVVTDQFGNHPDDVFVEAINADGAVAASALTYASQQSKGPQHGYFFLEVPNGTYTVRFATGGEGADGYEPAKLRGVEVTGNRVGLGEVTVLQERPKSKVAVVAPSKATSKEKVNLRAVVRSAAVATGKLTAYEGRHELDSASLKRGATSLSLGRLAVGTHTIVVRFPGSSFVKGSTTTVTVKVVKSRR